MRILPTLLMIAGVGVLSSCRSLSSCEGPSDVAEGGASIPPLRIPVGLEKPNSPEALRIPELTEPERPHQPGACLDQPPPYFPDRRPGAEAENPAGR